jgi:hypothetical protein
MGREVDGHIVYSPDGFVAVNITGPGRSRSDPRCDWVAVGDDEAGPLARSYMAYAGPFTVDEDSRTVVHDLRVCIDPAMVGSRQVRHVAFTENGALALSAEVEVGGGWPAGSVILTWSRDVR